jgi:hypothetical protein
MSKDNIGSIFDKNKNVFSYQESIDFVLPRCIIGVEVELENMNEASGFAHNGVRRGINHGYFSVDSENGGVLFGTGYWNVKSDGSLRNSGVEFVTKKLFGKDLSVALDELNEYLNIEKENLSDIPSDRCSVHVHLDVTDLNKNEYARLLLDYAIFENVLFHYCGVSRKENLYCLPFAKSDDFKRTLSDILTSVEKDLDFKKHVSSFPKYSSLNLNATSKYGSLEFRLHGGTYDMMRVKEWINIIMCLKKNCINNNTHNLHREISRYGVTNYLEKVFENYHRVLDYDDCETDIVEGLRLAQDIILYNNMQESSLDYFKHNSVFEGGLDLDTENITSEIISELLEYYEIPHPLDKHISRLEKKIKSAGLKNWINIFMYNEKMNKIQQYQEEELEDYEEERDYDEEEYYDEE